MNCPHCNTPNDPSNQFCISCGGNLYGPAPNQPMGGSARDLLGILTGRIILALFGLMIVNRILSGLAFIKEFRIPDFDLSTPELFSMVIFIVAIALLINYAVTLRGLWPQAYPKYGEVAYVFTTLLYVIAISMAYRMIKPIILAFAVDSTPLMLLQLACLLVTVVLVIRVSVFVYQNLPVWLSNFKNSLTPPPPVLNGDVEDQG